MGLRDRISSLLGRKNGDEQSPNGESPETGSAGESNGGEPDVEADDREYERELREFVYLDRDSVVSLLASIEGAIKQERIEQIGSRSKERVAGGVNASISGVGAKVEGEQVEMGESSSEVVHNYAIQSLFDQLDKHRRRDEDVGLIDSDEETEVDVSEVIRGKILRVDVELETHYLYRFYKVMMYLQENIPEAVGPEDEDVLELIESMFGAEIPVSGRVLDYQVKDGRIQPGDPDDSDGVPLHIVGQLNALKLWQDVPDALFDEEEYTVFCRVEETYDEESWHPLSLAQKIETVSSPLAQLLTQFMERAAALAKEEASDTVNDDADLDEWVDTLAKFDERAGIDEVGDDLHREFLTGYVVEKGVLGLSPSGGTELIDFYTDYATYLRDHGVSLSKNDESEATDYMIFDEYTSLSSEGETIDVDALQIESQIVAIYW
ncbi:DUF6414 family protein [Halocalculus aciditolerans]|uniref:Uncharacterized protein n=1 Tax=Halocalculus aciditolerans TaxID=1383812 RepID=A0A830FLE1_9EURY|nr:hypothetical protein [Halocalculus aciditolerans]GGL67224.1 hypothetical protein GCM10009039_26570 [Halocalculus aciditolerans]